jgi:hypothetical protein
VRYGHETTDIYAPQVINRVSRLGLQLDEWYNTLSDALVVPHQAVTPPPGHIITLNMYFYFLILLLHRPYLAAAEESSDHVQTICDQARRRCEAAMSVSFPSIRIVFC